MIRSRVWRGGTLEATDVPPALLSDYLQAADTIVWVDVSEGSEDDFAVVADELGFHPLAVEDATGRAQRPKFDVYEGHYFIIAYAVDLTAEGDVYATELAVFFDERWLVTVHKGRPWPLDGVLAAWDAHADLTSCGTGRLLHVLLDEIVETHLHAAQILDDEVEDLDDALAIPTGLDSRGLMTEAHHLRSGLGALRRVIAPMPEVLAGLTSDRLNLIDDGLEPYFRDVHDHAVRAAERLDAQRDVLNAAVQTHLALQGQRLNEITKQLAGWAALLGVSTVIAGIYGMNFELVPDEGSIQGFLFAIGLMLVTNIGLFVWLRRRGWL